MEGCCRFVNQDGLFDFAIKQGCSKALQARPGIHGYIVGLYFARLRRPGLLGRGSSRIPPIK